ncbi:protein kinase domain-containing protein [Iningainema tapete]|uniref:non-specific serine/threonine protein kinase n=1 Tax=Iningainema tapete BLCC-T55 TaxID=2748662 RepID=A0A8J6XH39_9CYAN|nr:protein kinase [Iningainema tapete]MBD2776705.1 protein kinase [Iningainema tapete BLCC-T55]
MIGQLLAGHYKVLEVLSEGGFGQTYIVEDIHLPGKPRCVLKHLKTTSTDHEILHTTRKLFQKEAETLQQLGNHDQIPRLLAYFEEKQEFYLVQEFVQGHTLSRELFPGKRWNESQIVEMLLEVLGILEFVHSHGVIHRDIKPDNLIRRASDRKLVLIDFGAIKQLRSQTAVGMAGQNITLVIGTRGYMPSEQTRRLPRPSSDIYALGMMGIQALTGVLPLELQDDPNTGEILWQHLTSVSPTLAAVLTKMTHYHFKDRYQTATEVIQALQELTIEPIEDTNTTTNLHELTLEWEEAGEIKTRKILEKQQSKNLGRIRIGRNAEACDIVLPDPTVSGLHVEIFFHSHQQKFYLRNLRQKNPPIVDGQLLLAGEMPLKSGSSLRLGQQNFKVSAIICKEYPVGYTPVEYGALVHISSQKALAQTVRVSQLKKTVDDIPPTVPPGNGVKPQFLHSKVQPVLGGGVAVIMSAIGGLVFFNTSNLGGTYPQHNLLLQQPQLCRVVSPPGGKYLAKLRPEPQTEVGALKQLYLGEKVLFIQAKGDFVQIKLSDGTQGWVFSDEIHPCNASSSTNRK